MSWLAKNIVFSTFSTYHCFHREDVINRQQINNLLRMSTTGIKKRVEELVVNSLIYNLKQTVQNIVIISRVEV